MTLDAVHFDAMAGLIEHVDSPGRARDRHELAERLWREGIVDPHDRVPLEPIEPAERQVATVDELALADSPFERVTAVDGGSLNPTTFQNGLVVDVAHAAAASTPTDVDLHRRRTIVAAVHGPPGEVHTTADWTSFDADHGRSRLVATPSLEHEEETAVHGLSLEAAEIDHALDIALEHGDCLLMDGSVYPAGILHWADREGALEETLYAEPAPRRVLQRAVDLVDRCRERELPLVGVVKNWTARGIVRGLDEAPEPAVQPIPWPTDASLFQQLLAGISDDRTALRWTSWFAIEGGAATGLGRAIEEYDLDAEHAGPTYDLAAMVVLDPREHLVFRVEAPAVLVEGRGVREAITRHVLAGIAREGGPPPTLRKADELARISRGDRRQLKRELERTLATTEVPRYDDLRWGGAAE